MKWVLLALSVIILVSGCTQAETGGQEYSEDVCDQFDRMVDMCWCKPGPEGSVLFDSGTNIETGEAASLIVESYFTQTGNENTITSSYKLNDVFYNVFSEDIDGNEEVFTVSSDGKIIKTVCGV